MRQFRPGTLILITAAAVLGLLWIGSKLSDLSVIQATDGVPLASSVASASRALPDGVEKPDNIVIFVADGLGFAHLSAARVVNLGIRAPAAWDRFEAYGWHQPHPLEGLIIDSAAAATALATGRETIYGALSVDADGRALDTLFEMASKKGYRTGVVTDSYIWDATPAAFVAHSRDREQATVILEQLAGSDLEILFGELVGVGGSHIPDWSSTVELLQRRFLLLNEELVGPPGSEPPRPVAAIFAEDAVGDLDSNPNLPRIVSEALNRLSSDDRPFVLLVESEEPDTASHQHDFDRLLRGMRAIEATLSVVLDFAASDGRTLVLFTSDHETGGLVLSAGDENRNLKALWASWGHTASVVPVMALGPGAQHFDGIHSTAQIGQILALMLDP